MTKKYNLTKILFISIFSFILLFGGIGAFLKVSPVAFAEESTGLKVEVLSRGKEEVTNASEIIDSSEGKIYSYEWENVSKIRLSLTHANITNNNVSLKIECLKDYATSTLEYVGNSNRNYIEDITGGTIKNKAFSYEYNIDKGETKTFESVSKSIKGWGIYKFCVTVGDQTFTSSLYEIKPSTSSVYPIFTVKTKGNSDLEHNDFICSISNTGAFKYADTSRIKWYVEGVDGDDKHYRLTASEASSNTEYLYEDGEIDRTGLNFTFNPQIKGKWTIYCVYKPYGTNGIQSDTIIIDDNQNFNITTFYICISAVAVGLCGIIALWQFIKTKKEKVW